MGLKIRLFDFALKDLTSDFEGKIEGLAGDFIEQGQIKKCLEGKSYYIQGDDGNEEWLEPVSDKEFNHYWSIYNCIELGGWPNGQGWLNEQEWVVMFYNNMKMCYDSTMTAIEIREMKKNAQSTVNH
jgi:hypothetical protein